MTSIIKSETTVINTEDLFTGREISITIPDRPQRKNFSGPFSLRDEAFDAKKVADKYRDLTRDGLIKAVTEFKNDYSFEIHMALAGLTCEIYLKSLLFLEDGFTPSERTKHKLTELFNGLNKEIKQRIIMKMGDNEKQEYNFDEELDLHKDIFNGFRYSYELNGYRVNAAFMIDLMDVLHEVTNEMDW